MYVNKILFLALFSIAFSQGPKVETEMNSKLILNKQKEYKIEKDKLTKIQYEVTKNCGTEPPFNNEYWDNKEDGIYVDIISGKPLFSSIHKYDSGTGWPSFFKVINENEIKKGVDYKIGYKRVELKSSSSNAHLGHLFNDGPDPTGQRYCINSASLRFIKYEELDEKGYSDYKYLFQQELNKPQANEIK